METSHAGIYMPSSGLFSTHHSVTVFPTKTYPLTLHPSISSGNQDSTYVNYGRPPLSRCRCIIDLSTPETLERDFYAWLNGMEPTASGNTPCCLFAVNQTIDGVCSSSTSPSYSAPDSSSISPTTSTDGGRIGCSLISTNTYFKPRARRKRNITKGRGTNLYGRQYCPGRPLTPKYPVVQKNMILVLGRVIIIAFLIAIS